MDAQGDHYDDMSGGKSSSSGRSVQKQKITPQAQSALDLLFGRVNTLAGQPAGNLAPGLSADTQAGLDVLRGAPDPTAVSQLTRTVEGGYANPFTGENPYSGLTNEVAGQVNPFAGLTSGADTLNPYADLSNPDAFARNAYAGAANPLASMVNPLAGIANRGAGAINPYAFAGNDLSGVTDSITQAAKLAVGDRFSQAGRTGSPAEGMALGGTIARELAPYAFGAQESQLNRLYGAGESALGRGFGSEEARLAALRGAGESALDRGTGAEEARLGRLTGTEEAALGRGASATESQLSRLYGAGEASTARDYAAEADRLSRLYGAGESALGRGTGAEESRLARLYGGAESALGRGFGGYESERDRQLGSVASLLGIPLQQAQNLLTAGGVQEQNQLQQGQAPYTQLQMLLQPIIAALSGSPQTTIGRQSESTMGLGFNFNPFGNAGLSALMGI